MGIATLLLICAQAIVAGADEKYVTDPVANSELHAIEKTWNNRYLNSTSDFSGSIPGFSETAKSGLITVTLKVSDITYTLDVGELDFDAFNPIQETKCFFDTKISRFEIFGSGSVTINTQTGQLQYSCNSIKMGIKNFVISGDVNVNGTNLGFSDVVTTIDNADYYFTYSCSPKGFTASSFSTEAGLPTQYRNLLNQRMKQPDSQITRKATSKSKSKMTSTMRDILQN